MTEVTETAGEMLQRLGADAKLWAEEFNKTAKHLGYSDMDEGWLIGWFANAIENTCVTRKCRALSEGQAQQSVARSIEIIARQTAQEFAQWLHAGNSTGSLSRHAIDGLADSIAHVLSAQSAVPGEVKGWQPIETAPKDGTNVLAAFWLWNEPEKGRGMEVVSWDGEAWSSDAYPIYPPTHWMPLPASPEQGETDV